jgi:hypothetical protein
VDLEGPFTVTFVKSLNGERSSIFDADYIATYMVDRQYKWTEYYAWRTWYMFLKLPVVL